MNRKKFLSLASMGIFTLLFPSILFSKNRSEYQNNNVNVLLKQAASLRKQKKYNQARQIYQQIISQFPNEIRAYDGMRKVILSQKNKEWQVILLFKGALLQNPNNVELKQRLYNEYFRACLGNKKVKNLVNFNGRLLSEVKQKYETFVNNHPNNINVQKQYAKIIRLLDANADTQNPKQNTALKNYRKLEQKKFKKRFSEDTVSQLEVRLNKLITKPYSKDRKPHIRELYKLSFQKLRKQKNNTEALNKAVNYFNTVEKNDPLFLKYIRDMAKLQKNYDVLITIETQNHTIKNNFGPLCLF
ncbi:tetratricopeptide repeat protein [Chryseobacterium echinoideorum]|uniref:tetratricopeptide repeat protein n=1 Tax=Chryseobacterium echinoideorum TaxID=1549648 RepID=UPI001185A17C|nr:tetratricopeptide repeat protein [Chryseobacterium echinoideorum]